MSASMRSPTPTAAGAWSTSSASASTGSKFTSGCGRARRRPCSPGSSPTSAPCAAPSSAATCGCRSSTGYDTRHSRPRRVDRLLGRVPDRGRQGRRLVRGRCFGRNRVAHRRRPVARRRALNLERSLRLGDELGGHIVTGHVDAVGDGRRTSAPEGDSTRIGVSVPTRLGADDRRQGLDRARRRVADRQRRARCRGRIDPLRGQHHSRTPRSRRRSARSRPADSSMSRSTCSRAISTGCWPLAHSRNTAVPTFHHIAM